MLKRRATVQQGQLVLEEPIPLPEGSIVEVTIGDDDDALDLSESELAERDALLAAALVEIRRGEGIDARDHVTRARHR